MSQPNLLFLITDQQRGDTIDPATPCQTPNLDRLAAGGTRFVMPPTLSARPRGPV